MISLIGALLISQRLLLAFVAMFITTEPLKIEAPAHQTGTAQLTLKNASSFPLRISLSVSDYRQAFSINPSKLTMSPGTRTSPTLSFTPGASGTLKCMLVLRVEPDGMEFEIAVAGICCTPPQPPPSVPSSVPASAPTHAPPPASTAPPTHPVLKQMESIHNRVIKSSSAPLSQVPNSGLCLSEKALSAALESTKSHLVFGTVAVGATSCQKITLRNTLTSQKLPLSITIIGNRAFQVCEAGSEAGQEKLDLVLNPSQEVALSVLLQPCNVESLSATLLCRHRSSRDPYKWKIPLQGYGGRGELVMKHGSGKKPIIVKDLSLELPSGLQTTVRNVGQRTLFIIIQAFADKQFKEPASDLSVQPTRMVVSPGQDHDIFIVANATLKQLAKTPGIIGALRIISGEEILRRRYKRMKNKEVKARRITNPDLLKLNWMEEFTGEQEAQNEPDVLPPQPEDAVVFFNSCTITQVEVWGERRPDEDQSTSVFACLPGEETLADLTFSQERVNSTISSLVHANPEVSNTPATSWDVLPHTLSMRAEDISPQVFFVCNFTSTQQMLEVSSDCKWLEVRPREAVLAGHSSVGLSVTTHLPHTLTKPVTCSLKVMGENESRSATITIIPSTEKGTATHRPPQNTTPETLKSSQSVSSSDTDHPPSCTKGNPYKPSGNTRNTLQLTTSSLQPPAAAQRTNPSSLHGTALANARPALPVVAKSHRKTTQKCQIELMSDDVKFQDTHASQETYVKVMLRNLDKIDHSVQAEVKSGPFAVRHKQFTIKSGHYVNVPVYFKPVKSGLFTDHLQLLIVKDKVVLPVTLTGRALP